MAEQPMGSLIQTALNKIIEDKFSQEPAYQQLKAVRERRTTRADVKSLIDDSRAMFSGANKPAALFSLAVGHIQNRLAEGTEVLKSRIQESRDSVNQNVMEAKKNIEKIAEKQAAGAAAPAAEEAVHAVVEGTKANLELMQYSKGLEQSTARMQETLERIKTSFMKS